MPAWWWDWWSRGWSWARCVPLLPAAEEEPVPLPAPAPTSGAALASGVLQYDEKGCDPSGF